MVYILCPRFLDFNEFYLISDDEDEPCTRTLIFHTTQGLVSIKIFIYASETEWI